MMEEEDARHMTERMLDLTLEIISLLTGETFTAVKSGDLVAIMVPPFHFMIPELPDQQRLLELTNKMIELLTGESGLFGGCSLSGHDKKPNKNLGAGDESDGGQKLKGAQQIGGPRKGDSPVRPPPSLHSQDAAPGAQEIPHHNQVNDLMVVKVPDSDDEDVACATEDRRPRPPLDGAPTFPQSHDPAQEAHRHPLSPPQTCPRPRLYSQDSMQDDRRLPPSIQGEDFIVVKVCPKEEEEEEEAELHVGGGPQAADEVEILLNVKVGEISAGVGPALPPSYIIEDDDDTAESFPGEQGASPPAKPLARPAPGEGGSEKFSCRDCGRRLTSKYNLMIHRRVHTGERPFSCSECGRSFTRKENLQHHQKLHSDQRAFPCYKCAKSYVTPAGLIRHFRSHTVNGHRAAEEAVAGLPVAPDLEVHIVPNSPEPIYEEIPPAPNSDHSPANAAPTPGRGASDKGQFTCSLCGKCFGSNFNLQVHQRVHTGERPFSCPLCGRTFTRKENLKRHHVTHSGEKPFPCPDCGKHFTQKGSLIKHWRTHAGAGNAPLANRGSLS